MKRNLWTMIMVTVLAGVVAVPMMAHPRQQGPGQGQGRGMGRGMGMGPDGPGGRGPGGPMAVLRGIELTDAQREQIRGIMEAERENAPAGRVRDLDRQLTVALLADAPDTAKLDELKAAIVAGTAEELAHRIAVQSKIVQVLTAEQRAQARENAGKAGPPQGRGR
jgi:Spy/CpxP family protein refolding chaperone